MIAVGKRRFRLSAVIIKPVVSGVAVDDIEQNIYAPVVRRIDRVSQILPGSEARIDLQKVLDAVSVVGVQVFSLLPYRADPERSDP